MSCQHGEDACCQYCLEKVQTTTEDSPPTKRVAPPTEKEYSPPEKTMTPRQKRISTLIDSSFLAAGGAMWYFSTKQFFKMATLFFDSILGTIGTRTRTRKE